MSDEREEGEKEQGVPRLANVRVCGERVGWACETQARAGECVSVRLPHCPVSFFETYIHPSASDTEGTTKPEEDDDCEWTTGDE